MFVTITDLKEIKKKYGNKATLFNLLPIGTVFSNYPVNSLMKKKLTEETFQYTNSFIPCRVGDPDHWIVYPSK